MKTIFIDNAILSNEFVATAIENNGIVITCNEDMNIEISEEDYEKLCEIIDPMDIKEVDCDTTTYRVLAFDANDNELIDPKMTEQYDMAAAKKYAYEYVSNISTCGIVSYIEVTDMNTYDKETINID